MKPPHSAIGRAKAAKKARAAASAVGVGGVVGDWEREQGGEGGEGGEGEVDGEVEGEVVWEVEEGGWRMPATTCVRFLQQLGTATESNRTSGRGGDLI
jgi:hypothetical protein